MGSPIALNKAERPPDSGLPVFLILNSRFIVTYRPMPPADSLQALCAIFSNPPQGRRINQNI